MKVRDRVCDICGRSVYEIRTRSCGCRSYQILKRNWDIDIFHKRVDLCELCYKGLESYIKNYNLYGDKESSDKEVV